MVLSVATEKIPSDTTRNRSRFGIYPVLISTKTGTSLTKRFVTVLSPYKYQSRIFLREVLQRIRYSASSCKFKYLLFSLRSIGSCFTLLPPLPVPSIFPSIKCLTRQFLNKMRQIQLALLRFIVCCMLISYLTLCKTSFLTPSVQLIISILGHHVS